MRHLWRILPGCLPTRAGVVMEVGDKVYVDFHPFGFKNGIVERRNPPCVNWPEGSYDVRVDGHLHVQLICSVIARRPELRPALAVDATGRVVNA